MKPILPQPDDLLVRDYPNNLRMIVRDWAGAPTAILVSHDGTKLWDAIQHETQGLEGAIECGERNALYLSSLPESDR